MTEYTADDFEHARFATHPDGRVAARIGRDLPWVMPCIENCESVGLECNGLDHAPASFMANEGWTPARDHPRPLTPDAITDAMIERAHDYWERNSIFSRDGMRGLLAAALTEPAEDPEVVALAEVLGDFAVADEHNGTRDDMQLARLLHGRGVRVVSEEAPR